MRTIIPGEYNPNYVSVSKVYIKESLGGIEAILEVIKMKMPDYNDGNPKTDYTIKKTEDGKWQLTVTTTYTYSNKNQAIKMLEKKMSYEN